MSGALEAAKAVKNMFQPYTKIRSATVDSVDLTAKTATVKVGGGTDPRTIPFFSRTPAAGERVVVLEDQEESFVVGKVGSSSGEIGEIKYGPPNGWPGWIVCDGRSTSGYPALAALYGANIPDARGRVLICPNTSTSEFTPVGSTGGNYHGHYHGKGTLDDDNVGAHTHTSPSHKHGLRPTANNFGTDEQGFPPFDVHRSLRSSDRSAYPSTHGTDNNWMDGVAVTIDSGGAHNHTITGLVGKTSGGFDGDANYSNNQPWVSVFAWIKYE